MSFFKIFKGWNTIDEPSNGTLSGKNFFALWSSLGVGLLVLSTGSFLIDFGYTNSILAVIIGSAVGSFLLALGGKIGSDNKIPSITSVYPTFGKIGVIIPALFNIIQLIGWTTFEIMIMSKVIETISDNYLPNYISSVIIGIIIIIFGMIGPIKVIKRFIGQFVIWIVYATSIILLVHVLVNTNIQIFDISKIDMNFFGAFDIVIVMPISWLPLVADYNRFAKKSKTVFFGTFIGFTITNSILFAVGLLFGISDITELILSIQMIFFGLILLILLLDDIDNAFADAYSASISTLSIFPKLEQKHLIIGIIILSTYLSIAIPIVQYEIFLILIGAIFIPLFAVVIADYYLVDKEKYKIENINNSKLKIGRTAVLSWILGLIVYYLFSPISPIYVQIDYSIGSVIPSFLIAFGTYLVIRKIKRQEKEDKSFVYKS